MSNSEQNNLPCILVSACLLGIACRYDGRSYLDERIASLSKHHLLVPVCPEQLGGLATPRPAAEIVRGRVLTQRGDDITPAFLKGAQQALLIGQRTGCTMAILQPRSPSCGVHSIYDGTFSQRLIRGQGIFAALLTRSGILVCEPENLPAKLIPPL